jgi:hypothetical protein
MTSPQEMEALEPGTLTAQHYRDDQGRGGWLSALPTIYVTSPPEKLSQVNPVFNFGWKKCTFKRLYRRYGNLINPRYLVSSKS